MALGFSAQPTAAPGPAFLASDPALQRRRELAALLSTEGLEGGPVLHPLQGVGRLAKALAGAFVGRKADEESKERQDGATQTLARALSASETGVKEFRNPDNPNQVLVPGQDPGAGALAQVLAGNPDTAGLATNIQLGEIASEQDFRKRLRLLEASNAAKTSTTLSTDEIAALGLPSGTVAQRDATGKVSIISEPAETFETVFDDEGGVVGQQSSTSGRVFADPRAPDLLTDEEFAQELDLRAASRPQVSVSTKGETKFQETLGAKSAERFDQVQAEGFEAVRQNNELDAVTRLLEGVQTGAFKGTTTEIKRIATAVGIDLEAAGINDDVAAIDAVQALTNRMALRARNPQSGLGLTGNTSDRDVKFLQSLNPQITNTPEGINLIIEVTKRLNRRKMEEAELARDYVARNGTFDAGFISEANAFGEANDLFADLEVPTGRPQSRVPQPGEGADLAGGIDFSTLSEEAIRSLDTSALSDEALDDFIAELQRRAGAQSR